MTTDVSPSTEPAGVRRERGPRLDADRLASTVRYYDRHAESYAASTRSIDTSERIQRFAALLPPHGRVLDVGCGAGRDLLQLGALGFEVSGLDISPALAAIARRASRREVLVADLRTIDLPTEGFDGIWAMASLLHLGRSELPEVLLKLTSALRPGGTLFASVKRGVGEVVDGTGRWFTLHDEAGWRRRLVEAGLEVIELVGEPADAGAATGTVAPGWISSLSRRP